MDFHVCNTQLPLVACYKHTDEPHKVKETDGFSCMQYTTPIGSMIMIEKIVFSKYKYKNLLAITVLMRIGNDIKKS